MSFSYARKIPSLANKRVRKLKGWCEGINLFYWAKSKADLLLRSFVALGDDVSFDWDTFDYLSYQRNSLLSISLSSFSRKRNNWIENLPHRPTLPTEHITTPVIPEREERLSRESSTPSQRYQTKRITLPRHSRKGRTTESGISCLSHLFIKQKSPHQLLDTGSIISVLGVTCRKTHPNQRVSVGHHMAQNDRRTS